MNRTKFKSYSVMWLVNWKIAASVVLFVLITTYISYSHLLSQSRYSDEETKLQKSLKQVMSQLMTLRQLHSRLISRIKSYPRLSDLIDTEDHFIGDYLGPKVEYEHLRRRIYFNTKELWHYFHHQLGRANPKSLQPDKIKTILEEVADRKRSLLSDQEKLPTLDGYETWRRHEAASVGDLVQRRLHYLQHPRDCRAARKLICDRDNGGFGWQFRNLVLCLLHAYASERTLIQVHTMQWMYSPKYGWNSTFQPLSKNCTSWYNETLVIKSVVSDAKVTWFLHSWFFLIQDTDYEPYYIPKDLVHRITRFNSDPTSWWIGQMYKYIYKLQRGTQIKIDRRINRMAYKPPIVGVHIRRTDKATEIEPHDLNEYMSHVEDYYAQLELTRVVDHRRVFLATDDAKVLEEAIKMYPQYTFYGDYTRARGANMDNRFSRSSLAGLLVDLHMLTLCDYVVLTLSSNFGRMAYSLMQSNRVDASNSFSTLDHFYYFSSTDRHIRIAVMHHKDSHRDIVFEIGDLIDARNNYWNGTGHGVYVKSNVNGLFPWYKTEEYLVSYPFPEYKQVPIYTHSTSGK